MERLIPPRTINSTTIYKGVTTKDLLFFAVALILSAFCITTQMPIVFRVVLTVLLLACGVAICFQFGHYYKGYEWLNIIRNFYLSKRHYTKEDMNSLLDYKLADGIITMDGYNAAVLEIAPIELILFKEGKQEYIIDTFTNALSFIRKGSILKIQKAIDYSSYIERYKRKVDEITAEKEAYIEKSLKQNKKLTKDEIKTTGYDTKIEMLDKNIMFLEYNNDNQTIKSEVYYLIVYEKNLEALVKTQAETIQRLNQIGLLPKSVNSQGINAIMSYFFYGEERENFELPEIISNKDHLLVNGEKTYIAEVGEFPVFAEGNHWASSLFQTDGAVNVINFELQESDSIRSYLSKAIKETRYRQITQRDVILENQRSIELGQLNALAEQVQIGNISMHKASFYVMFKDNIADKVKETFVKEKMKLNYLWYKQLDGLISMFPATANDQNPKLLRYMQTPTLAAAFPFINNLFMDKEGDYLGVYRYPIFFDMWERAPVNKNRANSNMMILGTSGGGKTVTLSKLIAQQLISGTKVFLLDCEKEYKHLTEKFDGVYLPMHGGKTIINPFQIYSTYSDDDDEKTAEEMRGLLSAQRAFLAEWFNNLLELNQREKAALGTCIKELYEKYKITDSTDFNKLTNEDYPCFDDLLLFIQTKKDDKKFIYERDILMQLEAYMQLFAKGGIYAPYWNGKTTLDLTNNFVVFDFQQVFADSNTQVCNAQMMVLMRLLMREVIHIKDTNHATGKKIRVIVIVDEAHRYVSKRFPIALDTLEQFARRIRKYFGALFIATQNVDDFVGATEEMKQKATAVINNCQYSMLFGLNPDDLNKVQDLYKNYGGGLTETDLDKIANSEVGEMVFMVEPEKRMYVKVDFAPDEMQTVAAAGA